MKIHGKYIIHRFKRLHPDSWEALKSWLQEVEKAEWKNFHEVRHKYGSASNLGKNIVIFNIRGNRYRLGTKINYQHQIVLIKHIGTHSEYDRWYK